MTHVWPVFGEAPVPSTVSSYWRPEGVVFIFDSFLSAATAGFAGAGFSSARAGSAREAAKEHARRIFEIRIELSLSFIESFRAAQFTAASRKSRTPRVARRRPSSLGRSASSRGSRWAESRGCAACRRWPRPPPPRRRAREGPLRTSCLLYTSDAADEEDSVDLGGRRI